LTQTYRTCALTSHAAVGAVDADIDAADIATIICWGLDAGGDALDLRAQLTDDTLGEMVRQADLHCLPLKETKDDQARAQQEGAEFRRDPAPLPERGVGEGAAAAHQRDPGLPEVDDAGGEGGGVGRVAGVPAAQPAGQPQDIVDNVSTTAPVADAVGATAGGGVVSPPAVSLDRFTQTLRDYQQDLVDDAMAFVAAEPDGSKVLYASPAGSGKGSAELALLCALRAEGYNAWILTPSLEVLRGFLERCGAPDLADASNEKLAEMGETIFCTTPVRYQNRVLRGVRGVPDVVIYDEVHHAVAKNEVSGTLFAVAPDAHWIGMTATPYRGSPKQTQDLREDWGEPVLVLTVPEAVEQGWQALPTFEIIPLVDDDKIKVANGRFVESSANKEFAGRVESIAALVSDRLLDDCAPGKTQLPTAITVPSSEIASMLLEALDGFSISSRWVGYHKNAEHTAAQRAKAYAECKAGESVLITLKVLNEGVDLPWLKRIIDARPTLSPVAWLQQIGRIMRPGGARPEYVCVCRNLERHAYLMQGLVPREVVAAAQEEFEGPSARTGARALGLEALKRFKQIKLPLAGGLMGAMHNLYSVNPDTGITTEHATLMDPCHDEVIVASRVVLPVPEGEVSRSKGCWGNWAECSLPADFIGYATSGYRQKISAKQRAWWERSAKRCGLDPAAADTLTGRQFQALPLLLGIRRNMIRSA